MKSIQLMSNRKLLALFAIVVSLVAICFMTGCSGNSNKDEDNTHEENVALISSFIDEFDAEAEYKLKSTDPVDLNSDQIKGSIVKNYFSNNFDKLTKKNDTKAVYLLDMAKDKTTSSSDYIGVVVGEESGTAVIKVCGLFDKYEQTVSAFRTAFFLLSKEATQDDFTQLMSDEVFLYGGKSGEIAGVRYEVSPEAGYHSISLIAPVENVSF